MNQLISLISEIIQAETIVIKIKTSINLSIEKDDNHR